MKNPTTPWPQTDGSHKRLIRANGPLRGLLLATVITLLGAGASAGPVADSGAADPVICGDSVGRGISGCLGAGTFCNAVDQRNSADCRSGGPKCHWWNAWEADVEVLPEENAFLATAERGSTQDSGGFRVEGTLGCSKSYDNKCSVGNTPDACAPGPVEGRGNLKCDVTLRAGVVPENWFVEITCKDPANPCAVVRTTLRSDPLTGQPIKEYHVPSLCQW